MMGIVGLGSGTTRGDVIIGALVFVVVVVVVVADMECSRLCMEVDIFTE